MQTRVKTFFFIRNPNFHYHILNQHEKCIQMSTNKPSIGAVVLETDPCDYNKNIENFQPFLLLVCKALKPRLTKRRIRTADIK